MRTPLLTACLALTLVLPLLAATDEPVESSVGVRAVPTKSGEFAGTWIYVNRDAHYALWIRTKDGKPQVKLQYQSLASPESFETDWSGRASYYMAGSPATFSLTLDDTSADAMTGRWAWDLTSEEMTRVETASVTLERTGYGRTLAMNFKDFRRTTTSGSQGRVLTGPVTWTWIKISKRELLWDELPW